MATASTINVEPSLSAAFRVPDITSESAKTTSKLLQEKLEQQDVMWNPEGFHNHTTHHLLTLLAVGATPAEIERGYKDNLSYQRSARPTDENVVDDLHSPEHFEANLGKVRNYPNYLAFFQEKIRQNGWEQVLQTYLLADDDLSNDMLARLYNGFLHPLIQLGFGVEFQQPCIVAEGLAQAAVHSDWLAKFLLSAEKAASSNATKGRSSKAFVKLLEEAKANEKLRQSAHYDDQNKIRDGIMQRAPDEMIDLASQYIVSPDQLDEKTAEMINATAYFTLASQRPPHEVKIDFFYMHCINSSIFFPAMLSLASLTATQKVRLLEWKVRNDVALYVSRGSPNLDTQHITGYKPKKDSGWDGIFERVRAHEDDGHAVKLIRALAHGQRVCAPYEGKEGFVIKGDMWRLMGHMAIDSVEAGEPAWVRNCGFEQAWEEVPKRETS